MQSTRLRGMYTALALYRLFNLSTSSWLRVRVRVRVLTQFPACAHPRGCMCVYANKCRSQSLELFHSLSPSGGCG